MTNSPRGAKGGSVAVYWPECACGLTFKGPWELTAHFLEVYPLNARQSHDDGEHADVTRLDVKLDNGSSGAWEVVAWASDSRKDLRVAASIAHRVKSGDLKYLDTLLRQDIRDTCQVSMHVVSNAIEILRDYGILQNFGGRNSVACTDVDEVISGNFSYGQMLHTVMMHVARLEGEVSALRKILAKPTSCT
jgi:hypothetical protein